MMRNYLSRILQVTAVITFLVFNNVYAQKDKTTLSFNSTVQYGKQSNNLSVLVSSDFNGDYSLESIKSATWEDITKKAKLAADKVPFESGEIDLSKNLVAGKPLYIAFKYTGQASEKPSQRGWGVQNLTLKNADKSKTFSSSDIKIINNPQNHEKAGWYLKKEEGGIMFRSNMSLIASDSWAIVKISETGK